MRLAGLALVGFVAAIIASITGGNSLITVPVMILAGMAPGTAVATNMLVLTSLSAGAAARFRKAGVFPLHPTLGLVAASIPGSMLGAFVAVHVSDSFLRTTIAVAFVVMATLIWFQPELGARRSLPSRRRRLFGYAALGAWSIYGGMFSGGYATVLTMGCVGLFGLPLLESVALTRVVNLLGSFAATMVFAAHGKIDWTVGSAMSLAAVLGGWVGAHLALRWGPQTVRRLLFVTTVLLAGKVVHDARRSWHSPGRSTPVEKRTPQ
jgi:uncharacterized protein